MTPFTTSKRSSAYWVSFDLAAGAADAGRSPSCLEQDGSAYAAEERLSSPSFPGKMTLVSKCNGSHAAVDANCVEKVGHLLVMKVTCSISFRANEQKDYEEKVFLHWICHLMPPYANP